jgi:nucleotide-binding universal stress UspA family protein
MIKRILVPVDFSKSSLKALDYALALAKPFKAEVVVLYVVEPVYYSAPDLTGGAETMATLMDEQRRLARQQLLKLEQRYAKAGAPLRGVLQTGTAYRAIATPPRR